MKRHLGLALGVFAAAALLAAAGQNAGNSQLEVMIHYTGASTVDDSHKIYVALWNAPDFVQPDNHAMPIDVKSLASKNGSVTFSDIKASPVYVSTAYDPKGAWDAQSMPPAGSSLGLYSKQPGKPAPIDVKPGHKATVHLTFDDSVKAK